MYNEIKATIQTFRRVTGLQVCVKLFEQHRGNDEAFAQVHTHYSLHNSAFCRNVKRTRNEHCKECDLRKVPALCERDRSLFIHTCHAGADEVILPLFVADQLMGVVYVGQFRTQEKQPKTLPMLSNTERDALINLARMLRSYLTGKLKEPGFHGNGPLNYRAEAIYSFLQKQLDHNPTLSDLAGHLGLSTTRSAHVVKELTGSSFITLKDDLRLERARNLLGSTYHKVAYIASLCGFSSSQYFHRFFKRKMGLTPLAYRGIQQVEV